jgi:hypothetical protein
MGPGFVPLPSSPKPQADDKKDDTPVKGPEFVKANTDIKLN